MRLALFKTPGGGRAAVDMARVEAITEGQDDNGVVTLVTHSDTYRVNCYFDNAVKLWRKCEDERQP